MATENNGPPSLPDDILCEIFSLLDMKTLKSCSLTNKALSFSAKPFLHRSLVLAPQSMFLPRPRVPGSWNEFSRLSILGERGLLRYTHHLSITFPHDPRFAYGLEPYIQHLRTITNLWTLEVHWLDTLLYVPKMVECFGGFLGTLQSLNLIFARGENKRILYFVCLFPNLRDLKVYSVNGYTSSMRNDGRFDIKTSPLLDGTFDFQWDVRSESEPMGAHLFLSDLVALPSGLKFRTLKLSTECTSDNLQLLVNACAPTLECMELIGGRSSAPFLHRECLRSPLLTRFTYQSFQHILGSVLKHQEFYKCADRAEIRTLSVF